MSKEVKLSDLSDEALSELHDACCAETILRDAPAECVHAIKRISCDELDDLYERAEAEIRRRQALELNAGAAHLIEQADARGCDDPKSPQRRLEERCARLFNLVRLGAPDPVVQKEIQLVNQSAAELFEPESYYS